MQIDIDPHTLERALERGATFAEIAQVVESGAPAEARGDRVARSLVFPFDGERNGRHYAEKRVKVIYVVEAQRVVTVTVLVYYGKWD